LHRAPLFRARDILHRFDHYAETLIGEEREKKLAKLKKKPEQYKEELDRIADLYKEAKDEARQSANNLREYLDKEAKNEESTEIIIAKVEEKLNLYASKVKLSGLMNEKERFLERLRANGNEDYYNYRIAIGDFNYGRRLPGTDKCRLRRCIDF
jgi:chromosome segregation ATPase